jgi:hypothetical protein
MTDNTGAASGRVGNDEYLLQAENLRVTFRAPGGRKLHAVDEISLGGVRQIHRCAYSHARTRARGRPHHL